MRVLKTKLSVIGLSVLLLMSMMLSGCSSAAGKANDEGFVFVYRGHSVEAGKSPEEFVDKSGLLFSHQRMDAGYGLYDVYSNVSICITNHPSGIVFQIDITDDLIKTKEGITKGSSYLELKKTYGEPQEQSDSSCTFVRGKSNLICFLKDGKVVSIRALYLVD